MNTIKTIMSIPAHSFVHVVFPMSVLLRFKAIKWLLVVV